MTLHGAVGKWTDRTGVAVIRRRAWPANWRVTVLHLQERCYWSHQSPTCPWSPTASDLIASDWQRYKP